MRKGLRFSRSEKRHVLLRRSLARHFEVIDRETAIDQSLQELIQVLCLQLVSAPGIQERKFSFGKVDLQDGESVVEDVIAPDDAEAVGVGVHEGFECLFGLIRSSA